MSDDPVALEASARAASNLEEHLRDCVDCRREAVRHLYGDERVQGHGIRLCAVGAPLLASARQAYRTYQASIRPPGEAAGAD